MAFTQLVRRVGKSTVKSARYLGKHKKSIGIGAGIGAYGAAASTNAGVGVKGMYDVYKQRRKEGEGKVGAGLRTIDPFHSYGSGKRIARTDKKLRGWKAFSAGQGPIGLAGYLKEKKRLGKESSVLNKVKKSK